MIIEGDCIEVIKTLEPNSFDLIFADPPYNIGMNYGEGREADMRKNIDYFGWCHDWMFDCVNLLSDDGCMWILMENHRILDEFETDFMCRDWDDGGKRDTPHVRNIIIWRETFNQYQTGNFANGFRYLYYFLKNRKKYRWFPNAIHVESQRQKNGDPRANPEGRLPDNVWEIPRLCGNHPGRVDWHPCQLPQTPLTRILRACLPSASEQVCNVLELFSGSGIFGVATKQEGHNYTGIEKNPEYAAKANERIEAYARQLELGI